MRDVEPVRNVRVHTWHPFIMINALPTNDQCNVDPGCGCEHDPKSICRSTVSTSSLKYKGWWIAQLDHRGLSRYLYPLWGQCWDVGHDGEGREGGCEASFHRDNRR